MESRRKRRPDFLIRILERELEDALGDLFFGVEVLDIALDDKSLKVAFRSTGLRGGYGKRSEVVATRIKRSPLQVKRIEAWW